METDQKRVGDAQLSIQNRILGLMSLVPRLALVDDRAVAATPGRVSVLPCGFAAQCPFWPRCFACFFVASTGWATFRPSFWPLAGVALALNVLFSVRVKLRFRFGCVNPSRI